MTDPKNPFEAMMAMGQEWAKTLNPALESFTLKGFEALLPTMPKDMMETVMGKTFNPEGLEWDLGKTLAGQENIFVKDDISEIVKDVQAAAEPGDSVIVMSNGGFQGIHGKLQEAFREKATASH